MSGARRAASTRSPRARGLTLVELLVTIILVALTVSLVVGGIGQASALLARVAQDQGEVYQELMARAWLRQTLASAVAPASAQTGLEGDGRELRLRSFRPLLGSEGIATDIAWSAAPRAGMLYAEGDQQMLVEGLPELQRIEYQDGARNWHDAWPPDKKGNLPQRIRLVFAGNDDLLEVEVVTQTTPYFNSDEALFDRE
jgi:hypothetical protein